MADQHETLYLQARSGDRVAIDSLLQRHIDGLRGFIRLRCGALIRDRESCSDIAQSVCREVLEDCEDFEYRGEAAFRAWLFEKALSKIRNRARYWQAQKRDARRDQDLAANATEDHAHLLSRYYATSLTPSRVAVGKEAVERVERAFDQLPPEQREVVLLARVVGLTRSEIATQLDRSEDSVRGLLARGLTRLTWILSHDGRD
jgi:RNA polymerase sigma-70 factor (ECF subfamily)